MERSPHGRHTAGQSWQAVARASTWKRTRASRSVWVVVLGAVIAMVAAAITFGGGSRLSRFAAPTAACPADRSLGREHGHPRAGHGRVRPPADRAACTTRVPSANAWTTGLPATNKSAVIVSFKALPSRFSPAPTTPCSSTSSTRPDRSSDLLQLLPRARGQHRRRPVHRGRLQGGLGARRRARERGAQPRSALDPDPDGLRPQARLAPQLARLHARRRRHQHPGWDAYPPTPPAS